VTDDEPPSFMSFITPMVAIGDRGTALDRRLMRLHGIEAVLSLAPLSPGEAFAHHLQLEVVDRVPLAPRTIAAAVAFIDRHVRDGRRVLLHCEMGISRSPALAVCYLHESQSMTIDEAVRHVQYVRPTAAPHPELLRSIEEHYGRDGAGGAGEGTEAGAVSPAEREAE
jgi:histidinol-phosphate aminotransferase